MSKKKAFVLLLVIISIASFLRLYHLTTTPPGLYPDEAMDGNNAIEIIDRAQDKPLWTAFQPFYPENNGREGLFMNVQAVFLKVLHVNEPWVLRLPSALFGILTVLGLYFLGKELFSKEVGLLASFFLATNFWHINFSRISFRAITAPFFLVWALYFLLVALRRAKNELPTSNFQLPIILAGILYGLGFYSYIAYRVTPVLILAIFAWYFFRAKPGTERRRIFLVAVTMSLVALATVFPLAQYFLNHPADFLGRTSQISIFSSPTPLKDLGSNILKTLGMFNVAGDSNWRHNISGSPELFWPVGMLFVLGVVFAIRRMIKNIRSGESFGEMMLLLVCALAALPVVISNEGLPHALRSILLIPPVMLLAALGAERVFHIMKKYLHGSLRTMVVAVFFVCLTIEGYASYFIVWANNPNVPGAFSANYVAIGRAINTLPTTTPKYVIVRAGGVLVRGIPMPTQTVMFITNTFLPEGQQEKNVHYIFPGQESQIPQSAAVFTIE